MAKSKFCWKDLDDLLSAAPTLLKRIHIEKIIIVEPLQGDQLTVPIGFIGSFEVSRSRNRTLLYWKTSKFF